jgi:hypothetical protein
MNWTEKLKIKVIDDEDGGCTIQIDWDETDSDLAEWTSWGEKVQQEFILDALRRACDEALCSDSKIEESDWTAE